MVDCSSDGDRVKEEVMLEENEESPCKSVREGEGRERDKRILLK